MQNEFKQLEKDANMTVKAVLTAVEDIVDIAYVAGSTREKRFPFEIEEKKRVIVKRIWAMVRKCMAEMRSNEYSREIQQDQRIKQHSDRISR